MQQSLPELTSTAARAGPCVELARYRVADTERILVGQRVLGIVHRRSRVHDARSYAPIGAAGRAEQRGYGGAHHTLRRRVAETVDAGRAWCWRCGKWIPPGTRWCLGHTDDRRGYMGPEHAYRSTVSGGRISGGRRAVVLDDAGDRSRRGAGVEA